MRMLRVSVQRYFAFSPTPWYWRVIGYNPRTGFAASVILMKEFHGALLDTAGVYADNHGEIRLASVDQCHLGRKKT